MSNLVTFDQAKMLKELGFDGECIYWYNENGTKECPIEQGYMEYYYEVDCFLNDWNAKKIDRDLYGSYPPKVSYSAPTVSSALDWIREKMQRKGLYLAVRFNKYVNPHYFGEMEDILNNRYIATDNFDTHPLAESALLSAVLEYLIEKEK